MLYRLCRHKITAFLFLGFQLLSPVATAAETEDSALIQTQQLPSMAGYFFRVILSLAIIIVLTYAVLRVIKKQQEIQQKMARTGKDWIKVFDYHSLGTNRGIYLVQILSAVCIIAVSDNHISILKEIDPADEEWQTIRENLEKTPEIIPSGLLQRILPVFRKPESTDFKTELGEILNGQVKDQLDRTHRLYRRVTRGGRDGE